MTLSEYYQSQQQLQQPQLYKYSFKVDMTAKGLIQPSIHVYSNDAEIARRETVEQYIKLIEDLRAKGQTVAGPTTA
jgi:GH35 family endo-1,4-beta-xylanase